MTDWESAKPSDTARFGRFFRAMLDRGIYLAPSQFEAAFLSAAHTDEDIAKTVAAAKEAFEAHDELGRWDLTRVRAAGDLPAPQHYPQIPKNTRLSAD